MNEISDTGASYLADLLQVNKNITHLDLSNNNITSKGASYLKDALASNTKIKFVYLHNNYINKSDFRKYPNPSKYDIDPLGRIVIGPQKPLNVIAQIEELKRLHTNFKEESSQRATNQELEYITSRMEELPGQFNKRNSRLAPKRKAQRQLGPQGQLARELKRLKIGGQSRQATNMIMQMQNVQGQTPV